jgi:phage replication-related protein YjqB (UPF0714/DUF867 family)
LAAVFDCGACTDFVLSRAVGNDGAICVAEGAVDFYYFDPIRKANENMPLTITNVTVTVMSLPAGNINRKEHCQISNTLAAQLGVQLDWQVRVGYQNGSGNQEGFSALFTVRGIFNDANPVIRIFENTPTMPSAPDNTDGGVFRLWQIPGTLTNNTPTDLCSVYRFAPSQTITDTVPDIHFEELATQADPDLSGNKWFIERVTTGSAAHRLMLLVPHGGSIDDKTDEQIPFVTAQLSDVDPTIWKCEGEWGDGVTDDRWHITSNDAHPASFPGLNAILNQAPFQPGVSFQYAISLHGFSGTFKGIVIGGRATMDDKRLVRDQIKLALGPAQVAGIAFYVGDIGVGAGDVDPDGAGWPMGFTFDDKKGVGTTNTINVASPNNGSINHQGGIQIEQSADLRNDVELRERVARGVGDAASHLLKRVYIRDTLADAGNPHNASTVSSSPDIILKTAPINLADLSHPIHNKSATVPNDAIEAGQINYAYIRVYNKGPTVATGLRAHLFYSLPATLVTPMLWKPIGSVDLPAIQAAPAGDTNPTVVEIAWTPEPASTGGYTGHVCAVCIITEGNLIMDKLLDTADGWTIDHFRAFIRLENRAAWRNFQVVDEVSNEVSGGGMPFWLPGAKKEAARFVLEVMVRVPTQWGVRIHLPLEVSKLLSENRSKEVRPQIVRDTFELTVPPEGTFILGEGELPAGFLGKSKLWVDVKGDIPKGEHIVQIRQIYKKTRVGALTWQIVPPALLRRT